MPNLVGYTLGKYQLVDRLGRGGMADVYKAYQPGLERFVAVKVLHPHLAEQPDFVARFRREARSVSALVHPNIVQVFDFDIQGDNYYMAMAYVEGGRSLKEVLKETVQQGRRLRVEETLAIAAQVADALGYAHRQGMVHRDVKPANILIPSLDHPILSDFGIAHLVDVTTLTRDGAMVGTPAYMPPEQSTGGEVTGRSDIYALGVTLYEMLTGKPPYDADTPYGVILKHIGDPLVPPHLVVPLPLVVEPVVLKALAKQPQDRFATADEMAAALREALEAVKGNGDFSHVEASPSHDDRPGTQTPLPRVDTGVITNVLDANPAIFAKPSDAPTAWSSPTPMIRAARKGAPGWVRVAVLGGLVALVAGLAWDFGLMRSQPAIPAAPPGAIFAAEIDGSVGLSVAGKPAQALKTGDTITVGAGDPATILRVEADGKAVISLDDGSVLYAGPATTVGFDRLADPSLGATGTLLRLPAGALLAKVALQPGGTFVIETPLGTRADVFGSLIGTRYDPQLHRFDVDCLEGHCRQFGGPGIPPLALTSCQHSLVISIGAPEGPDRAASEAWRGIFGSVAPECPTATPGTADAAALTPTFTRMPQVATATPTQTPTASPTPDQSSTPTTSPNAAASNAPTAAPLLPTSTISPVTTSLSPVVTLLPTATPLPSVSTVLPKPQLP